MFGLFIIYGFIEPSSVWPFIGVKLALVFVKKPPFDKNLITLFTFIGNVASGKFKVIFCWPPPELL